MNIKTNLSSLILILFYIIVFTSCKKDQIVEIQLTEPVVFSQVIEGKKLLLKWTHDNEMHKVIYKIELNGQEYLNPGFNFELNLEYETVYTGKIIAQYAQDEIISTSLKFTTDKKRNVIIANAFNEVYCIDLYTHQTNWKLKIEDDNIHNPYTVWDKYLIKCDGELKGYNLNSGELEWSFCVTEGVTKLDFRYAIVEGDILYVNGYRCNIYAINLKEQKLLWQSNYQGNLFVVGKHIYLCNTCSGSEVLALDKTTGDIVWRFEVDANSTSSAPYIYSQPLLDDNSLFFGDNIGRFYSVNAITGEKNWSTNLGSFQSTCGAPAISNNTIIAGVEDSMLAIDKTNGSIKWRHTQPSGAVSSPSIMNDKIFGYAYKNGYHTIFSLNLTDGSLIWQMDQAGNIWDSGIAYNEKYYLGGLNFKEIDIKTGQITWQLNSPETIHMSTIIIIGEQEEVIYSNDVK